MRRWVRRWAARAALALIVAASVAGLYIAPVPKGGATHVWPVHSHHILFCFGMICVWIVVVIAAILAAFLLLKWLAEEADF